MTEQNLISRIKLFTILAVVILGALVLGVIYTVVKGHVVRAREAELKSKYEYYLSLTQTYETDIEYFNNRANLEEIARKYLGWGKQGETIFVYK